MQKNKSIGIIGGMGPDASAHLYQLMIDLARTKFGARENQDYPDIILHSLPVPDFISDQARVPEALAMLKNSARQLGSICGVLGIACNTAHLLINELQAQTATPFISMVELTAAQVSQSGHKRIGLLATPTTFRSNLYQDSLEKHGVEVLVPLENQIERLGDIVPAILAGDFTDTPKRLTAIADGLVERGAQAVVLGCTELPLVFPKQYKVSIISSLNVLANTLLEINYLTTD